jgi:putative membrane protein
MTMAPLRPTLISVALLSIGIATTAAAQTAAPRTGDAAAPRAATTDRSDSLARGDRKFVEEAAQGGLAEVQLGTLAAQKATHPDVKQFAQRMVDDHSKANSELQQLAATKGVTVPTAIDAKTRREQEKLQGLSGDRFDREYMEHMVSDHKQDVKEFRKASESAKDPQIKAFAAKTLPILEEHLKMAQTVETAVKNADRGRPAGTTRTEGTTPARTGTGMK